MSNNLEFHYVVSFHNGAWCLVEEGAYFPDGTIYDWDNSEWTFPSDESIEDLDLEQYRVLGSALGMINQLNGVSNA